MQEQQQQQDTAVTIGQQDTVSAHHRAAGQAYFDSVLAKAKQGADPFAAEPPKKGSSTAAAVEVLHPDVAAFGATLERHRTLLLASALIVSQAFSWVLIKGALNSMHTPGVLAFLHLLAAAVVQLVLAAWQVVLVSGYLLHGSVYTLLCWVTVLPLLISYSRAADANMKTMAVTVPQHLRVPLVVACLGLCMEMFADQHLAVLPLLLLCGWGTTQALQHVWQQLKVDATLGHRIMNPEFLYRVRALSDLEDGSSPSTISFMAACLPALPALVLGLACLEGRDLVEHEPSVPTLSVLLFSCLAFASATCLRVMLAYQLQHLSELRGVLTAAAAILAIVLDFMERAHELGWLCLIGVSLAVSGSMMVHVLRWKATKVPELHAL
uniref:Uncharacterized protein n=1 Tax=Tetradesmus obliquus TaxID=3088 RepID=A0A383VBY9_TETOB|eukprot:jgi/Sobl393_1/15585/SZX63085.1